MTKYVQTQTRKVLSSYGGVGSIIETVEGAILIEDFDKWRFFNEICKDNSKVKNFIIEDNRLTKRLQKSFPVLDSLLQVPTNLSNPYSTNQPKNYNETISSKYFPEWFYCSKCNKFMKINDWWKNWKLTKDKYKEDSKKEDFIPAKCFYCYDESKKNKAIKKYHNLEQVRFIMTSPTGNIKDIPWDRWVSAQTLENESSENQNAKIIRLDFEKFCCDKQELYYIKSNKFSDLAGIRIECKNCKQKNTLAGLFALKLPENNKENTFYKVVIRTGNSVYYPIIVNSIYLPAEREIAQEDENKIIRGLEKNISVETLLTTTLVDNNFEPKYKKETIEKFIKYGIKNEFETEVEYRLKEYNFIIKKDFYNDKNENKTNKNKLIFQKKDISKINYEKFKLQFLYAVKKLTMTTVQTGYTRQEPLDKDIFLKGEEEQENKIKAKYTSAYAKNTKYLPAIESFGEGIFLSFEKEKIDDLVKLVLGNDKIKNRMEKLFENCRNHDYPSIQTKFNTIEHLIKFIFIHTLSHILIKEFEFLCGYSATSLNERLFIDESNMQGLLIYTVAGSEGSYGGLVSQAQPEKFFKILHSAINRAKDCSSDPICYDTEDGQGVGGLNMASCYSCTIIPENACEEFNSFLDRALLIDEKIGFFKEIRT